MDSKEIFYPEFGYPVSHLSAFSLCIDTYIISLKNGKIVRFKPDETDHFREWLNCYNVRDIEIDLFNSYLPPANKKSHLPKPLGVVFNLIKRNKGNEKRKEN
ncbi:MULTISPECIES: hypothetical protein [unclassified Arcicella]|jgi:hypothetical protein|uniref:hypothetical protein n=1 Tax=unclassified Arcicella TaxID=2644986 RepID=UPI002862855F|nr:MULTISPECIES: hypothetical protein [unclassified Arcicella]MCA6441086.1 hypothetical protein [Chitinophagaceae bacterium]MCA6447818.1 hypothetical protein [Chitinophagaceae bacterium]MDR6561454.1 hypothetical protein [Arcicella sp. BE51]MDR6811338.1 hypothetical protein [Arcicella sp. BE140]MDR6822688.1 hypothetical protein [Arcicella sp. BE139]